MQLIKPTLSLFAEDFELMKAKLSPEEIVAILSGVSDLCMFGETEYIPISKQQKYFWDKVKSKFDYDLASYRASVENGKKGGRPRKNNPEETQTQTQNKTQSITQDITQKKPSYILSTNIHSSDKSSECISKKKEPPDEKFHEQFEDFWAAYIPVQVSNGKTVAKGSKSEAEKKFIRILQDGENYENIRNGLQRYLNFCRTNDQLTCQVTVFLNQKRWADGYDSVATVAENTGRKRQEPVSLLNTYAEIADQYRDGKPLL